MSDKMRWRRGDTNPVLAAVDSETVIAIGDLLYLDTDDANPAGDQADGGTELANQITFAASFLGVAMQRSRSGDTDPIRVATTGVFEYPCASAAFEIGDKIGVDEAASGTALEDQKVVGVTGVAEAIGRCARREPTARTTVEVEIISTVMRGGVAGTSGA